MTETEFNFSDLYKSTGVLMPIGWYNVVFVRTTVAKSQTGKSMIKAFAKVEDGTRRGQSLYTQFVLSPESPGAMRIFFRQMSVFGMKGDFWAGNPNIEQIAENIKSKRATVEVIHATWQGVERENIRGIKASELTGPIDPALLATSGGGFESKPVPPSNPSNTRNVASPPIPSF